VTTSREGTQPAVANSASDDTRRRPFLPFVEFACIVGIFVADRYLPVSKTPYLFAVGWLSLRLRGLRWGDVGFTRPRNWLVSLGFGALAGVGMEAFELFVTQPLLIRFTGRKPDFSEFVALHGNVKLLLLGLAFAWVFAGFGEEMVWRGYLMNRVAGLLGRWRGAWVFSLIVVNAAFGVAHRYQGVSGIIDEALMGGILGVMYLAARRNLTVPIVAHGVADSIDAVLFFIGHYPGT
jgi:CAAX protease family protein